MSTKCSSGAGPYPLCPFGTSPLDKGSRPRGRFAQSLVTPGEAQRSGFAGKRRSKGTNAVFAARRKRSGVDFATTSRRGQRNSPPAGGEIPQREKRSLCSAPVGIPGYQNGWVFHLRPRVRSPCAYFFENGAPGSARGCWKRAAHQKTITFFATLRKYFKEILLCNNSDAMLRFCYTFP